MIPANEETDGDSVMPVELGALLDRWTVPSLPPLLPASVLPTPVPVPRPQRDWLRPAISALAASVLTAVGMTQFQQPPAPPIPPPVAVVPPDLLARLNALEAQQSQLATVAGTPRRAEHEELLEAFRRMQTEQTQLQERDARILGWVIEQLERTDEKLAAFQKDSSALYTLVTTPAPLPFPFSPTLKPMETPR
ncbi:MAG: hypothetical protein ACRCZF_17875 [Gemmataceae bacterium]